MFTTDRLQLQSLLEGLLGSGNVYFQPPPTVKMAYPCIVYKRDGEDVKFADDKPYAQTKRYLVTVMDRDPDSAIPDRISKLPLCVRTSSYPANGLNHDVFALYF